MRIKKHLLLFTVLTVLIVGIGCSWFDKYNDIEYPAVFSMADETPGDPITFSFNLYYYDKVPDTNGINFDWELREDTFWILLQTKEEYLADTGRWGHYHSFNVGVLDTGSYTLLFEGDGGIKDTFGFVVEDSLYRFVHRQKTSVYDSISGKVVYFTDSQHDTLRRIFPDMLIVKGGWFRSVQDGEYLDSLTLDLYSIGAEACTVSSGRYTLFNAGSEGSVGDTRSWNDAFERGWLDESRSLLFTYNADTTALDGLIAIYVQKDKFEGLSLRMGNGFARLYQAWDNY